jgi:hypothetical protein
MQITRQMMYDAWKRVQDWVSGASSDRPKVVNVNGAGAEIFTDAMPGAVKLTGSNMEHYGPTVNERPAASAVPIGAIYMAVQTQEIWRSDGTNWWEV